MPLDDSAAIGRLIDALRPWLGQLVIVGGWAHQLHRLHPAATPPAHLPLRTRDADLAFSVSDSLVGDIGAALKAANFTEELSGDHTPPVAQYRLGGEDEGFYAEFLAPLRGGGYKRNGAEDATVTKAGVTAQKLRYLEILLIQPCNVTVGAAVEIPLEPPAQARIANPVSFIAQKLLIQEFRKPDKRPQDVLYIHDTLELFGGDLESLKALWREQVRPLVTARVAKQIVRRQREQFVDVTEVIRASARIPADRTLTPEKVRAACAYGLDRVFG